MYSQKNLFSNDDLVSCLTMFRTSITQGHDVQVNIPARVKDCIEYMMLKLLQKMPSLLIKRKTKLQSGGKNRGNSGLNVMTYFFEQMVMEDEEDRHICLYGCLWGDLYSRVVCLSRLPVLGYVINRNNPRVFSIIVTKQHSHRQRSAWWRVCRPHCPMAPTQ